MMIATTITSCLAGSSISVFIAGAASTAAMPESQTSAVIGSWRASTAVFDSSRSAAKTARGLCRTSSARRSQARAAPGVWVAHPQGRLALYRAGRLLWRSRMRIMSDEVSFHRGAIAIGVYESYESQGPTLWMARLGAHEFRVAESEEPIGWVAGGLVTQHGNAIRVRGPDGTLYRTLARGR